MLYGQFHLVLSFLKTSIPPTKNMIFAPQMAGITGSNVSFDRVIPVIASG